MGGVCERFDAAKIDEDRANPAKGGDKHYERKKHLAWPREIQRQFLEGNNKCPKLANERERLAFLMARHCGSRRGDIRLRKWSDLRKTKDGFVLSVKETEKNGKSVNMPLDDELADVLAKMPRDHEYILTNTLGEPYAHDGLSGLIGDRLKKLERG
jgi:integrase